MGTSQRGPFSFARKENGPLWNPKRKGFALASWQLEELSCLPECTCPCARRCRVGLLLYDLPLAPTHPLPLCRSCRSAAVISVYRQCSINAASASNAAFGKQSAAVLPSLAPHDSKARLISVTTCRRFMAKPCTPQCNPQAAQFFKMPDCQCRGVKGHGPLRSLGGSKGGHSLT